MGSEGKLFEKCDKVIASLPQLMVNPASKAYIKTEREGFEVLHPNIMQVDYQKRRTRRDINLKARKLGFSTWKELEGLFLAIYVEGFNGAIVSYDNEQAKDLLSICKNAYDRMPEPVRDYRILRHDRENFLDFGAMQADGRTINFSTLYVGTGGGRVFGHGRTIHWLHLSELARYPDPGEIITGAQNAVPEGGYICIESTANGAGGTFYDLYQGAKRGENSYHPFFYPWWWKGEYRDDLTLDEIRAFALTEEEADLIEAAGAEGFALTKEHLAWRRRKMGDDAAKFREQFPEDDETCFLVSGSRAFDTQLIQRLIVKAMTRPCMREEHLGYGTIKAWRMPVDGHVYVCGVDTSQGLPTGDWSAGVVMDTLTGEHVASVVVKCSTQEFAHLLNDLGKEYGEAWMVVERQGYGHSLIADLGRLEYENVYEHSESDNWFPCTPGPGIQTTRANKPMMVEGLGRALREETFRTWDVELLGQARNYQRTATVDGHPKFSAADGHDDLLMAGIIANQAADLVPHDRQVGHLRVLSYA
jgi:hypothetical protein